MTSLSKEHGHLCVDTTQRLAHPCLSLAESPSGTPSAEQASLLQGLLLWHLNQGSKMGVMNVSMGELSTCATVTQWQSIFTVVVEATSRARNIGQILQVLDMFRKKIRLHRSFTRCHKWFSDGNFPL